MGQNTDPAALDSDGEFYREDGLTFQDLAYGDDFSVEAIHYRKATDNTAFRLGLPANVSQYGTFLPSQPVTRYGDFQPFLPGRYVTRLPGEPRGTFLTPPFARLAVGDVFTTGDDFKDFYRKLTPAKAVLLNPNSPLLKKALEVEGE